MKHLSLIAVLGVLLAGCQGGQLVRAPLGGVPEQPPMIEKLVDLGSAAIPDQGFLDPAASDKLFIGGEWVAVLGTGLNTERARVFLDGSEVAVRGGVGSGGLLFRLPGELRFRHTYTVRVETPLGVAETGFTASNLIVLSDARAGKLFFWMTANEGKRLFEEESLQLDCPGAGPFAPAPGRGALYATARSGKPGQDDLVSFELKVVHLGAAGGPKEIFSAGFEARSAPVSLVVAPDGAHAYVITGGELIVFDLAQPLQPKFMVRQALPPSSGEKKAVYQDLVLLRGGSTAAVLDEPNNRIVLIDLARPEAPAMLDAAAQAAGGPHAVGILADGADPNLLWVLTGLNAHQIRLSLSSLWSDKEPDITPTRTSLIRMDLKEGRLVPREPLDLPEGVLPLGLYQEKNGEVLLSAVAYEKETFSKVKLSLQGAANLVKGVRDSLFAGRIYRVAGEGTITVDVRSVNLPLSMARIEDSPLIYSSYRLSPGVIFRSLDVELAVNVLKRQSMKVREMSWTTILPPYKFFPDISLL